MDVQITHDEQITFKDVTKVKIDTAFDMFTNKIEIFQGKKKTTFKEYELFDMTIKSTVSKNETVDLSIIDTIVEKLLSEIEKNSININLDNNINADVVTIDYVSDILHEITDSLKEKIICGK